MSRPKSKWNYRVYYIGAPYGDFSDGELCYRSNDIDRCYDYISKHPRLYGANNRIVDSGGNRVDR